MSLEEPKASKGSTGLEPDSILQSFMLDAEGMRLFLRPLLRIFYQVSVQHDDRVPSDRPALLFCRSHRALDWLFLSAFAPVPFAFLAQGELFRMKQTLQSIYDQIGTISGLSAVWRMGRPFADFFSYVLGDGLKTQLLELKARPLEAEMEEQEIHRLVQENRLLAFFAREDQPELQEMACLCALKNGIDLVPVSLTDIPSGLNFFPFVSKKKPGIVFHEALQASDFPRLGTMNARKRKLSQLLDDVLKQA